MTGWLLDTTFVSELRKKRPDSRVKGRVWSGQPNGKDRNEVLRFALSCV